MMSAEAVEALFRLHQAERRIVELEAQVRQARRILEGDPGDADPRPRLLVAETRRKDLARRLEQAEAQERRERARARSHEQQLYSGSIHNPRELSQLVAELEQLKGRLAVEEDEELELLAALDGSEEEVASALAEATAARTELTAASAALDDARRRVADQRAGLPESHLRLYDRVATYRPPPPVVEVRGGICVGCRLPLSMIQARALRTASEPLVCETCGRILLPR